MDMANKVKLKANNALKNTPTPSFSPDPNFKINVSGEKFEAMDKFYHGLSSYNKEIYELLGAVGNLYGKELRKKMPEYKELRDEAQDPTITPETIALEHLTHVTEGESESLETKADRLMSIMNYTKEQKHEWLNGQYLSMLKTAQRGMK